MYDIMSKLCVCVCVCVCSCVVGVGVGGIGGQLGCSPSPDFMPL